MKVWNNGDKDISKNKNREQNIIRNITREIVTTIKKGLRELILKFNVYTKS